jgi:signal transduction histidine kinase
LTARGPRDDAYPELRGLVRGDRDVSAARHEGLRGLADRIDALGGALLIGSSQAGGTWIAATPPP